ncbi:MAG: DinB family protein [Candidatus Dormiibacterota bacterium]
MGPILVEAFRYNRWANVLLLDSCASLSDEQLQLTTPGTYGTIAATLVHLVRAERMYLWRLGGQKGRLSRRHKFPGVAILRKEAALSGDQLTNVAKRIKWEDKVVSKWKQGAFRLDKGVILLQALHHGNDHRTHVCTILGANGIEYAEMDVWVFGDAMGAIVPVPAKA